MACISDVTVSLFFMSACVGDVLLVLVISERGILVVAVAVAVVIECFPGLSRGDCMFVSIAHTKNILLTVAAGMLLGIQPSIIRKFFTRSMARST